MTIEEINNKKRHGDLKTAGSMLGISEQNSYVALKRRGSKYHEQIKETLTKIISMREMIAKETTLITQ